MTTLPRFHPGWVFVDTSAYYGVAAENDQNHRAATAILARLEQERVRLFTTLYVLAEVHALVVTRRRNPREALALLTSIESGTTTIVPVTTTDQTHARTLLAQQPDKLYSLTDALSFIVMERLGIARAFTFDRNFVQHGFHLATP
jgi:predicted nucleic acid-binding protein